MGNNKKFTTRDLAIIGMLSALCTVSIMIKIPYGNGAMVHLGTAAIFTFAIVFGGRYAGFAGAIGAAFFDLIMGFSPYTIWSFFIKGAAGFVAGSIAHSGKNRGNNILKNIVGCICAAAVTLGGYLIAWTAVLGRFEAAVANIPSSIISSTVGLVAAIPLAAVLQVALKKAGMIE